MFLTFQTLITQIYFFEGREKSVLSCVVSILNHKKKTGSNKENKYGRFYCRKPRFMCKKHSIVNRNNV